MHRDLGQLHLYRSDFMLPISNDAEHNMSSKPNFGSALGLGIIEEPIESFNCAIGADEGGAFLVTCSATTIPLAECVDGTFGASFGLGVMFEALSFIDGPILAEDIVSLRSSNDLDIEIEAGRGLI